MMLFCQLVVFHFCVGAALTYGIDQVSLIAWRRSHGAHWTERARRLWPARRANAMLVIFAPMISGALQISLFPTISLNYLYAALAGIAGATFGMWPVARVLAPKLTLAGWLRDIGVGFFLRLLTIGVLLAAGLAMPDRFSEKALLLTISVVAIKLWFIWGGLLWLLRVTGLAVAASDRLAAIVSHTAAEMKVPLPRVWLLRGFGANAVALPVVHALLVTERAVDALSDEELGAVCAHEFAHLNEPRRAIVGLILGAFVLLPVIYFRPAIVAWQWRGYFAILAAIIILSKVSAAFRRRLEKRADALAAVHEGPAAGTYARALERIYEINQVPAVLKGTLTHPNLYDRLIAAGVTPAYPRPAAPPRFSWQYCLLLLLLAIATASAVQRFGQHDQRKRPAFHEAEKEDN